MQPSFILGVAGGSGSGKTTFATRLTALLGESQSVSIGQDNYYIDQSAIFKGDGENVNFDHPDSLDFPLLADHLSALKLGRTVEIPIYDFASHKRLKQTLPIRPHPIVLVDGILILTQPSIRAVLDASVFIDTPEEIRFARRIHRDVIERGRSREGIQKQIERQVKPMHDRFVEPSKTYATECISGTEDFTPHLKRWADRLLQRRD
jgi:uridine kinase